MLYALGQGVQQDYQHAAQLFKTSADGGVAEAQYNIAVMYGEGLGIGRDPALAVQWYQKAAAQSNANAAFNLGVAYSNGVGVQQSMDQAAQWFRRAAAAGIVNAQFNLGLLYERGDERSGRVASRGLCLVYSCRRGAMAMRARRSAAIVSPARCRPRPSKRRSASARPASGVDHSKAPAIRTRAAAR